MNHLRINATRFLPALLLAVLGAGLCTVLVHMENRAVAQQLLGFPDSDVQAHLARPMVLMALCFLPSVTALFYALGGTLDRYLLRQFFGIFAICLSALVMIWLLIDLSDKIGDIRSSKHMLRMVGIYYATRSPAILLLLLPYSLLLSLLYSLGKLSKSREIVAMIQSGRGVLRITMPLVVIGFFASLFSLGLNYHWAPVANGQVDDIIAEASGKEATEATQVLYRNPKERRLWMIGTFPADYQKGRPLRNVEVTTTGKDQSIETRISASSATWDRQRRQWVFENPVIGHFSPDGAPEYEQHEGPLKVETWTETPWQLIKPGLSAEYLGIPDLSTWLSGYSAQQTFVDPEPYLTQWHYRWALPFACLVTVLLATPLSIHFSRRGPGGAIVLAVMLSALMLLVSNIVLALGESGTLNPAVAAWLPDTTFAIIGIYLFHRRITGRPIYQTLRALLPGGV